MRKKTIIMIADKLFWFIIMLLPVLAYLLSPIGYSIGGGTALTGLSGDPITLPDFTSYMAQLGINTDNVIYDALNNLFGSAGVIHFFNANSVILLYMSYIIFVEILHLFVDFILFIPRLGRKYLDRFTLDVELSKE